MTVRTQHPIAPLACKPWALSGLSERLIVSHYENEYGAAVNSLNAIRDELTRADLAPGRSHTLRTLKLAEREASNTATLHELYFGTLGGDGAARFTGGGLGSTIDGAVLAALDASFGGIDAWRREFIALAASLAYGPGWVVLAHSRAERRLVNQVALDASIATIDSVPILVLDMYEHAYHGDFGANAAAYIDTFMRNINWGVVAERLRVAAAGAATAADPSPASVSVETLRAELSRHGDAQVIDARPRHYFTRSADMMRGAEWRDPERIDEWSAALSSDSPVFVYCAYGYGVGCGVTDALRARGLDAKFIRGGLSAWYAAGGERAATSTTDPRP